MSIRMGIITVRDSYYHPNQRLLEAIHSAGHEGILVHPYRLWPEMTAGRLSVTARESLHLPDVVLPRQGAQVGETSLALIRQFQMMGLLLVNDVQAITIASNKFLTQQALTAAGLPSPETVFVNDAQGIFHAVDRLGGYPVVAKSVSGRQGKGVLRIMDSDEVNRQILPLFEPREGVMIQKYLPPGKRRDIRVVVVDDRCIAAVTLTPTKGEFRANFHLGADIRPFDLSTELQQIAIKATKAVGCDVAGIDMMIDVKNRPVIVEVNYSPGFKGLEAATGFDIAGRIIDLAGNRYYESKH